jgi:DNA-binding transcriptional ArsR family regulator
MTTFEAIVDPTRRRILGHLRAGEQAVGALVQTLAISQPAVSKHLRVLRRAGLVSVRVAAQRRLYRLRPEPLAELDAWLEPFRMIWSHRLDALEHHLDAGER